MSLDNYTKRHVMRLKLNEEFVPDVYIYADALPSLNIYSMSNINLESHVKITSKRFLVQLLNRRFCFQPFLSSVF